MSGQDAGGRGTGGAGAGGRDTGEAGAGGADAGGRGAGGRGTGGQGTGGRGTGGAGARGQGTGTRGTGEAFLVALTADVYAVGCLLEMDGRIPWLAEDLRGFEPCWVHVLLSGEDRALLVDTGLPVHREALLRRLAALVGGRRVSVLFTRCNEPDCVLNLGALMDRFPVERVYGFAQNAVGYFRPRVGPGGGPGPAAPPWERLPLGVARRIAGRRLACFPSPLANLATAWPYDLDSRVLFTSDAFGHLHLHGAGDPPVVEGDVDAAEASAFDAQVHRSLDWLARARPDRMLAALGTAFEGTHPAAEVIAPTHGCIVRGRGAVRQRYAMARRFVEGLAVQGRGAAGRTDTG